MPAGVSVSKIFFAGPGFAVDVAGAADVMHADVEAIPVALERLRQPPELLVPLEDQDALVFPGQGGGGREPADPRSDDDDIPVRHGDTSWPL